MRLISSFNLCRLSYRSSLFVQILLKTSCMLHLRAIYYFRIFQIKILVKAMQWFDLEIAMIAKMRIVTNNCQNSFSFLLSEILSDDRFFYTIIQLFFEITFPAQFHYITICNPRIVNSFKLISILYSLQVRLNEFHPKQIAIFFINFVQIT